MRCPICQNIDLLLSERAGIEIDYCPQCRGVWLDRGELDKIIERSTTYSSAPSKSYEKERKHDTYHEKSNHHGYPKKKESFLSELFDF